MIRLRAIGECIIEVGAERVAPDAELAFALLLALILADGRSVARRQLVDLLWPGTTEARARHNLRQTLYKLRQHGVPVETESNRVRLPASALLADVLLQPEFEGAPPTDLLRPDVPFGEFLAGYLPTFSAPFAAWVDEQRGVMHARLRRAVLSLLLDERRRGNWGAVETLARKCLQLDPLNEEATLALAEATAMAGSKRAALAILDGYLRELGDAAGEIRLPAAVLRRRIAERLHPASSYVLAETCFLGRAESMAFLNEQLGLTRAEGSRTVLLWGDAGIGKSRLLTEFGRMATLEGAQVVRVACQARDVERPLSIFMDGVPLLLALPGALGVTPESMEYLRRLTAHDPAVVEPSAATREAELLFASVRRAVFDLVDAVAAEAPLVLCLEDLHWLDDQSWRVLRELIGWLERRAVLVALSSRLPHATPTPPARTAPGVELHRLPPLAQEASVALFDAITAGTTPPSSFRDWCVQVADGNPLFLRLLCGHWLEKGQTRAPASVERLIRQRLDQLKQPELRLLQTCALFGGHATFERLHQALGTEPEGVLEQLQALEDRNLISSEDGCIACRHSLIATVTIAGMSRVTQRTLARAAATVLQAVLLESHALSALWQCAHLWIQAGETAQAFGVVRQCATHLLEVGLPEEALEVYRQTLMLFSSEEYRIALLDAMKVPLVMTSRWSELIETIAQLAALRRSSKSLIHCRDDELLELEASWYLGRMTSGDALISPILNTAADRTVAPRTRLRAVALALTVADNFCLSDAMSTAFTLLQPLSRGPEVDPAFALQSALVYHTSRGDLSVAVDCARSLIALGRDRKDRLMLARYLRFASLPLRRTGQFEEAEHVLAEAITMASYVGAHQSMLIAIESFVLALLEQSKIEQAEMWLVHAHQRAAANPDDLLPMGIQGLSARVDLLQGRPLDAKHRMDQYLHQLSTEPMVRRRAASAAVAAMIAMETHDLPMLSQVRPILEEAFTTTASWGGQDYTAYAQCRLLRFDNRAVDARLTARNYIDIQRRELFEVPAALRAL